ncbi:MULTISPECIES: cyanophycin synthetase [unclassified Achromobacter]|uniref:cyanophycin synthetase n=1 Tax=unclassified Achromobacter TaxID=2626865 RepID=UPI000B51BF10|nr:MULTISPECIES: cyanophycin synthetase [unclassified Achromobacter]OWT70330.1 cyanophycin synthetase [Achromobacter sp. HZ34]OWT71870.1 cyanophycin synthetase [Achromobacter sp. HZ28]
MEVSRIRALRGPNLWSRNTGIEAIVTCSDAECSIDRLPQFEARLRMRFPQLGLLRPEGHLEDVSLAHTLAHVALALQAHAGCPVTFCRTQATIEPGIYQVVFEYSEESVGRLALELAEQLCLAAMDDQPFDLADALHRLRDMDEDLRLGPSTGSIVNAAVARGIPFRRLTQGSMVQFGWGSRQRRIQAAETDLTSAISESIAQDKDLTKMLLDAAGVPVPLGRTVDNVEDAWTAAQALQGPVVVKPRDGSQGRGVAVNIETREQIEAAYAAAEAISDDVIVERYIPGHDFRMLVVGDTLVAAARRDPPQVSGDGNHTISELVAVVNTDPLRGDGHATTLTKIRIDDIAKGVLAKQGYTPDSVPPAGARVVLRNNANLSTGGSATDVTDEVHPEMAARVVTAARMIGLDLCGVDVVAESVHQPLEDQRGGIVEINAAPGLRMHLNPSFGKGRAVGEAIIANMYKEGEDGRIPVVAVAGTNGKTTTVRLTAHILGQNGSTVGMTNSDGVYIGDRRIDTGDCSGPRSARSVLLHPEVDAAVLETARGGILREGLAFDRCDVAVVTNIGMGDHLGLGYISTVEDLAVVKRVIVQYVASKGTAVLNAADPIVAEMALACPGSVTYFAHDKNHPRMVTHRAQGLRVVYRDGDSIVAAQGGDEHAIALSSIPLTRRGSIPFQVENAMAAVAATWALGVDWTQIERGLGSFVNDAASAPGRFNVFDYRGATVIADYGHNPDAMIALIQAVDAMPAKRRVALISGAGDRRDEDIRRQTELLGEAFDEVLLYQDQCQRGRADGEVIALLREGLRNASRAKYSDEIDGEFIAIDTALGRLKAGDLCLILVDQVEEALAHIAQRIEESNARA